MSFLSIYQVKFNEPFSDWGMWDTEFMTTDGNKVELHFPFSEMVYSLMGRADRTKGAIRAEHISTIGFLIADKETGPFDLHIHSIKRKISIKDKRI